MSGAGERRIVSVLVTDLVDSTSIAEMLGPERSKFLFDEVVGLMAEQVRRFDGTVAQLTGDGLLALFGAPTAHGDDAERAVRAALAIHGALARYAVSVAPAYGIELSARVAVNTGPVVVPGLDAPPDVLYNALGDTVNVAARLQPSAGAGGIAIGQMTARELAGRFALEPLGELELKGKAEPVSAFRVLGETEAEIVRESPLVGRQPELTALLDAFARLEDGLGTIVSITGEPGVGKSRLVADGCARTGGEVRFLFGNAFSYTEQTPFSPVRDLLRGWLGLGIGEAEGRLRLELKAALATALGRQAEIVYPFLATLLGLTLEGTDDERLSGLSRDSVQRQTFEAVTTLFEALAREHPLCLVFEDLHWADEPTLELIEELLELADREATALLLLHRTEREHGSWRLCEHARQRFPHRLVELELRPLAVEDSRMLAAGAAGADLPGEVSELLAARSGGNPFFLEEALRDLVERGELRPLNGHWELVVAADELTVPLLVQETLQARLDRLQPATRDVACAAAVIGRTFGLPLLERLTRREQLVAALSELQRLDLVVEQRRRPAPEYRFRHGLVQEVAYASLTESRRHELHLSTGRALEELHAGAPDEVYEQLARHFSEAGVAEKAVPYLLEAGDGAWALYADQAALAHYRRALGFMEAHDPRAGELLFKIALAHHTNFEFEQANTAWAQASERRRSVAQRVTSTERTERLVTSTDEGTRFLPGQSYHLHEWWFTTQLCSGLLRLVRGLNVVPDAAEELHVSSDGLRYRARLRKDAVWSDGETLTAADFAYAWDEIRRRRLPTAHLLEDVAETATPDDRTLEIRLYEPRSYFPYLLALPPTFAWPRHRRDDLPDAWRDRGQLVWNGAFALVEHDRDHALFVTNDRWHGARGNVGEVLLRFISPEATTEAWERGELDLTMHFASPLPEHVVVERTPGLATFYVGFVTDAPPFDDVSVRRAFASGVDRGRWALDVGSLHEPAAGGGFVPPAMPGHSHRIGLDYDPIRASELLADAGFPGSHGLPEITLASPLVEWGESLADQWREMLGARVRVVTFPLHEDPRDAAPAAACWVHRWIADFPDPAGFLTAALRSPSGHTAALYRDGDLLELLVELDRARDRTARSRLVEEFERMWISEHVALVPLGYQGQNWLRRPWVDGFWTTPILPAHVTDLVVRR
jgi:ABC-type transport system substrate-binding protein/class 3 adenylate cyclase